MKKQCTFGSNKPIVFKTRFIYRMKSYRVQKSPLLTAFLKRCCFYLVVVVATTRVCGVKATSAHSCGYFCEFPSAKRSFTSTKHSTVKVQFKISVLKPTGLFFFCFNFEKFPVFQLHFLYNIRCYNPRRIKRNLCSACRAMLAHDRIFSFQFFVKIAC